jgi:hypothetical protein
MVSPALNIAVASCAAARAGTFQARSGVTSTVMASSYRLVIAVMRPTSVTPAHVHEIIKQKAPGSVTWGFFLRAPSIKDVLSCSVGLTGALRETSQVCRRNYSNAVLNMFHYNKSNHLSREILKQQKRSYKLIVFNNILI